MMPKTFGSETLYGGIIFVVGREFFQDDCGFPANLDPLGSRSIQQHGQNVNTFSPCLLLLLSCDARPL